MSTFAISKVLAALPGTLAPDTMYCVRVGAGFDIYMTDSGGQIAYKVNTDTRIAYTEQTGTTYTLQASDAGTIVRLTNAADITVTVPQGVFVRGDTVGIQQGGAGQVTVVAGSGVDPVETTTTLKTAGQSALAGILCHTDSTGFTMTGERSPS